MLLSSIFLAFFCGSSIGATAALDPVVLINAGSASPYIDTKGQTWGPDPNSDGRAIAFDDPNQEVKDTEEDGLYLTYRDKFNSLGSLWYNISVPNGVYTVELHFAEMFRRRPELRVFDVSVQGSLVLDNYDAVAYAGTFYDADVQIVSDVVVTDGSLSIEFGQEVSHAMISAIGVFSPEATPSPTAAPSVTAAPTGVESDAPSSVPTIPGMPSDSPSMVPTIEATWGEAEWLAASFQPRIIEVEAYPAHKAQGFIGWPGGSIWCQGRPTYWWSGHDNRPEEAFCQEADGTWTKSSTAVLNRQDELNVLDGPVYIDRHDCTAFDVNQDGIEDIVCIVGANTGTGTGWNEVYYTQPDGTIVREMADVGLYKYPTMRTRLIQNLTAVNGDKMVMITTTGGPRTDGQTNAHRMFRLNETFQFDEVPGPWVDEYEAECLEICDINNDGYDDFITCDYFGPAHGYVQNPADGSWTELDWSGLDRNTIDYWNGARVADVTGDGLADIIVAGPAYAWLNLRPDPYVRVFPGKAGLDTVFDFENPIVDDALPFETMDVEVIDLNDDGLLDIYVVQWNHTSGRGGYCQQTWNYRDWWTGNHDFPPDDFVPPGDPAPDYLYLSIDGASWNSIQMEHSIPGCGRLAKHWGEKSLAVAHGSFGRVGHNVILDWSPATSAPSPTWGGADPDTEAPTTAPTPLPTMSFMPTKSPSPTFVASQPPSTLSESYQPRVIDVEAYPAAKAQGFIGWPGGTIWCQGRATYWWSGHDNRPEEPYCEEADGTWTKSSTAVLNRQDDLNILDGPVFIDRHDCTAFYVNDDDIEDIICVVGANKGTGTGWNEVYYTQPDGSIVREMADVGLYKYPTMRTRLIQNLTAFDGTNMVMITTTGGPRVDGQSNAHRLFRHNSTFQFEEVEGPFSIENEAVCLEICDINNDGVDDMLICDEHGPATAYIQDASDGTWTLVPWTGLGDDLLNGWNGARVADVTGDGLADLLVAGPARSWLVITPDPYFRVFPGVAGLDTVFDFQNPVVDDVLPFQAMDVEVIDLNDDGLLDMYVVQWNYTSGRGDYCQMTWNHRDWWVGNHDFPPVDFVPPGDKAPDSLYLSVDGASWNTIVMEHSVPGCGSKAKKWGEKSLAVAHGSFGRIGHNVILDWAPPPAPSAAPSAVPSAAATMAPTPVPTSTFMPTKSPSPTTMPSQQPTTFAEAYQPRVIDVEAYPAAKAQGFIGWPGGTIWCQGRATYWWSGHDNRPEEPYCEEADGTWTKSSTAVLNRQDDLNILDGPAFIDRHDCTAFYVNDDDIEDIICVVGANKGTGTGWNEVYYTQPDGSIVREMADVGLYKYPTMRTRLIQNLTAFDGTNMVMITTTGGARADGQSNAHRLFRHNSTFQFEEVEGPFNIENEAICLEICDINNDGVDDMVICDERGPATAYTQDASDGTWTELDWSGLHEDIVEGWNGARIADVTGDGIADLLVAGPARSWLAITPDPYLRVFPGTPGLPTAFDFENPVLDDTLEFQAQDVEVIDLNDDGLLDMYVVQWNITFGRGDYCQMTWNHRDWWEGNHDFPPVDFVPPGDKAPDFLYLSVDGASWDVVTMEHSVPGCGYKAKPWGEKSLAVAHGSFGRIGHNVILDWSPAP